MGLCSASLPCLPITLKQGLDSLGCLALCCSLNAGGHGVWGRVRSNHSGEFVVTVDRCAVQEKQVGLSSWVGPHGVGVHILPNRLQEKTMWELELRWLSRFGSTRCRSCRSCPHLFFERISNTQCLAKAEILAETF